MQMQGKDADDVADAIRHHLVDDALALVERDEAGRDDAGGFRKARMRQDGGGRRFRRQMAVEQRSTAAIPVVSGL